MDYLKFCNHTSNKFDDQNFTKKCCINLNVLPNDVLCTIDLT